MFRYITTERQLVSRILQYKIQNVEPILDYAIEKLQEYDIDMYVKKRSELFEKFPNCYHSQKLSSLCFDHEHLMNIMDKAYRNNCKVLVDSEDKTIQNIIESQTNSAIANGSADFVFKTYQMYRKDMFEKLVDDLEAFEACGLTHNIKLVRGAYIMNDHDVVHDTKDETDRAYNNAVKMLLKLSKNNEKMNVIFATHNEESINLFKGINEQNVHHAFLMGMEKQYWIDDKDEFKTNKMVHIPFGPILKTYPYMLRRLIENNPYTDTYIDRVRHKKIQDDLPPILYL